MRVVYVESRCFAGAFILFAEFTMKPVVVPSVYILCLSINKCLIFSPQVSIKNLLTLINNFCRLPREWCSYLF